MMSFRDFFMKKNFVIVTNLIIDRFFEKQEKFF